MAFKPSYNIMDRDTHNALVNAFRTGGIAYTDDDGTVHKIADDYINSGGGSSLPSVTSADAGKVLAVNDSGEWAAEDIIFKIIENAGTLDKKASEIDSALRAGKYVFILWQSADNATIGHYPVIECAIDDGSYYIYAYSTEGGLTYIAASANDYPTVTD